MIYTAVSPRYVNDLCLRKWERFIDRQIMTRRRKAERNTVSFSSWGDGVGNGVWVDISKIRRA